MASLPFWRKPLSDRLTRRKADLFLVMLLSAGLLFVEIGMWIYRDASYRVSVREYIRVHKVGIIGLFSLGVGMIASLCVRRLGLLVPHLKVPVAMLAPSDLITKPQVI